MVRHSAALLLRLRFGPLNAWNGARRRLQLCEELQITALQLIQRRVRAEKAKSVIVGPVQSLVGKFLEAELVRRERKIWNCQRQIKSTYLHCLG